jgi:hypothetical protein
MNHTVLNLYKYIRKYYNERRIADHVFNDAGPTSEKFLLDIFKQDSSGEKILEKVYPNNFSAISVVSTSMESA